MAIKTTDRKITTSTAKGKSNAILLSSVLLLQVSPFPILKLEKFFQSKIISITDKMVMAMVLSMWDWR